MKKISTEKIRQKLQKKIKTKITEVNLALAQQRRNALSEDCMQFFRNCCNCCGCFVCGEEDSEQVRIDTLILDIIDISTGTYFPCAGCPETPIDCAGMVQEGLVLHLNINETAWGIGDVYGASCTPFSAGCITVKNQLTGEWEGYKCYARYWKWIFSEAERWHWSPYGDNFSYAVSCNGSTPLSLALGDCYRFKLSTNEFPNQECWRDNLSALEPTECSCCSWTYHRSPFARCDCCNQPRSPLSLDSGRLRFHVTCG